MPSAIMTSVILVSVVAPSCPWYCCFFNLALIWRNVINVIIRSERNVSFTERAIQNNFYGCN
jgi:hypothetical protein